MPDVTATADTTSTTDSAGAVRRRFYRVRRLEFPEGHPHAGGELSICSSESRRRAAVRDAVLPPLLLGAAAGHPLPRTEAADEVRTGAAEPE